MDDFFKKDINNFIKKSQNLDDKQIKKLYYRLVKKYHPDMNLNANACCNEYMITLNYTYSIIKNKTKIIEGPNLCKNHNLLCKYKFINRFKKIEIISNKSLFFYKLGLDRILWASDYICTYSVSLGYSDEVIKKASHELYKAIQYLNESMKLDSANWWHNEAVEKIKWAYEINNRITKNFILKLSTEITLN